MNEDLPKNIQSKIENIRLDNTSGSAELAKKSAEILIELGNQNVSLSHIKNASISLINAQPNMASIFNLVNNLMIKLYKNKDEKPKNIVNNYCKKFLLDSENAEENIRKQALEIIKNNSTIITHSYSSTVLNTLIFAKKSGRKFSVICTESRPKNEGVKLAELLGNNKINVKLLVDSAVFSLIPYSDLIFVGGDAVTDGGLINKIGTKGIAMTAHHYYTPTYSLSSSNKFLPKDYPVTLDQLKDSNEIIKRKLSNVTPVNYYFDYTPIDYITGVITEKGILSPKDVKERIKKLKVHKSLASD